MIEIFFKDIKKGKLEKIDKLRDGCWINIEKATNDDLEYIAQITGLQISDLEDVLDPYELPRIERDGENMILFVRDIATNQGDSYTSLLAIIITGRYFITAAIGKNKTVESMINNGFSASTTQRTKLLINILLNISKNYMREIKATKTDISMRKKSLEGIEDIDVVKLIEKEDVLDQYISALTPMKNTIESIFQGGYVQLYSYDNDLIEDLLIATRQLLDNCSTTVRNIRALREAYQVIVTNRLNNTIRVLTSLTVILTIPTIIGSLYGMNINIPGENDQYAFYYIILFILLVTALLYVLFKKKRWF
ncbi:magnesium transporter CorA family protein [bacterium]|nr:magnesium transporter CorA family protein [bacterium]